MKSLAITWSLLTVLITGCSSLQAVDVDRKETWIAKAQNDLVGRDATVTTTDGRKTEGEIIVLDVDSLVIANDQTGHPIAIPLEHVALIQPAVNAWPAIGGFVGGGIVGAMIGAGIGAAIEEPQPDMLGFNTVLSGASGGVLGAVIGSLVGVSIGAGASTVTDYHVTHSRPRKQLPGYLPAATDSTERPR